MEIIDYMINVYRYRKYKDFDSMDSKYKNEFYKKLEGEELDFFRDYMSDYYGDFGLIQEEKYLEQGNSESYKFSRVTGFKELKVGEEEKEGCDKNSDRIFTEEYYEIWKSIKEKCNSRK